MSADEKPGLLERYSIARQSNHLEIHKHKRGAADLLGDVAMCHGESCEREPLGSMLMRLVCEFDGVKAEYVSARRAQANALARSKSIKDEELSAEMVRQAQVDAMSAHMHILQKLPSLPTTKEAFGNWCMLQANKHGFMHINPMPTENAGFVGIATPMKFMTWRKSHADRNDIIRLLSGKVLDLFLEPTCIRCSGRGILSSGYEGKLQAFCPSRGGCGGSGKRAIDNIGNTKEQHEFSYYLYGQAEKLLRNVEIRYYANQREDRTPA